MAVIRSALAPRPVVIVADMTFERRTFGVCVFRDPHKKQNLIWKETDRETRSVYRWCFEGLKEQGFTIQAVILDGKPGIYEVFDGLPIQMCQFHQVAIITRYLTTRPKLPAGQELRWLALTLTRTDETTFTQHLNLWHDRWDSFLKEKTFNPFTKRWCYTHKRLRAAYRSLKRNLPYLFTYQRYPNLNIPNTTNSLDGTFSHVKDHLRTHRGLTRKRKLKLIAEILSK